MESSNFQLSKYFGSWDEILNKYGNIAKDILIITNYRIDIPKTQSSGLVKIDSDKNQSSLYFAEDTSNDLIFKNVGKRYKFPSRAAFPAERQAVFQVLKNDFIKRNKGQNLSDFDDKLNSFMDRLVLVTSLELNDIKDHIKKDLQKRLQVTDVSVQYLKLEECIKILVTGGKKQNQMKLITNEDYENILKDHEVFENKLLVTEKTKTTFDNNLYLEFQTSHKTIEDFLDPQINPANKILHVRTQEAETEFVSMQIHIKISAAVNKDTYIMMKTSVSEETFERGVKVFEKSESFKFMIIEVDAENDSLFGIVRIQLENTLQSSSKRLIVITDVNSKLKFSRCSELKFDHFRPKVLADASLAEVLDRKVEFQRSKTTWREIAGENYLKNEVLLRNLLKTEKIAENLQVSKEIDKNLYVPRTFLYPNWLKPEVKFLRSEEIVYNQRDYEAKCKSKNIHWLEKDGETLKWMKTSRDILEILKYINEQEEPIGEDSMIAITQRLSILIDIAGMGKSTVLNQLAQQLKAKYENHWVVKVDLNDYTSELYEVKSEELKTCKKAIDFLGNKILKLSTDFEKDLFRHSCESVGNVVLLFDGFDEVASFYQDQVTQLIRSLLQTSIAKVFIASRPECAIYLETTFLQIRHSLQPFSKENQKNYLFNFMKEKIKYVDADLLTEIIGTILRLMAKSLSDRDYKFTGVPLITKLVAEFFEWMVCDYFEEESSKDLADLIAELERESFNLTKLYDHFVEKKIQIYYVVKCEINPSNPKAIRIIQKEKKGIFKNLETLAVQQILKTDLEKHLPKFRAEKIDEDDLEVLVDVGVIYQIGKDFNFSHQTYGEFGFNKFLRNNFDDEDCAKFISQVVLVDESYQIIRSFVNFWILEKLDEKTCALYQKRMLERSVEDRKTTPLHVAGAEGNENIFWFLYSALATKTETFKSKQLKIQNYFLKMDKDDCTAIIFYYQHCDDNFDLLNAFQRDFGSNFVKKLFTRKMDRKINLLHEICENDFGSVKKIFILLRENYSNDPKFVKELFLSVDDRYCGSFLHKAFYWWKNDRLLELIDELIKLKLSLKFDHDFVKELVLMGSGGDWGVFLSRYAQSKHFDNDFFLKFLKQLKFLCDEETLGDFILSVNKYSRTLLHEFCWWAKDFDLPQALKWVAEEFGQLFLLELISMEDRDGQTIFHTFISSRRRSNPSPKFLKILEYLHRDLGFENEVLLDILSTEDRREENCLDLICDKKVPKIREILDFLCKVFQNDQDSFKKLFNDKFRENQEVKEWMEENNFNVDFLEEAQWEIVNLEKATT
jgi:hypothetical protein